MDLISTNSGNDLSQNNFTKLSLNSGINLISYGILIKYLCKSNLIETAFVHYEYLKANNLIKDEVIFNLLIDGCSKTSNLDQIRNIYEDMLEFNIKPTMVTYNSILDSFVRAKDLNSAWKIFEDLIKFGNSPDNFTYSTLFRGIRNPNQKSYLEKALNILDEMVQKNANIDVILVNVLIDSCICLKDEKHLTKIFDYAISGNYKNLNPDIITFNTFIKGCAQMNLFDKAFEAFEKMLSRAETITPNDVSFNTMIDVCVRSENISLVWGIVEKMKDYGIKPDNFTYSTIIKGINKKSNFNNLSGFRNSNTNSKNNNNNHYYKNHKNSNSSNNHYGNSFNNNLNSGENNFASKERTDEGELEIAFKLFENVKMHSKPDEILYNCIMDACLRFEKIDKMMEFHDEMIRVRLFLYIF